MANVSDSWEVEITLKYEDDTPVDLTEAENATFAVYQEPGVILERFTMVAKTGFTTLQAASLVNAATGVVSLFLSPATTLKASNAKKLYAEARVSLTNTGFTSGVQIVTATDIILEPAKRLAMEGEEP